jgi:hypothetical protein
MVARITGARPVLPFILNPTKMPRLILILLSVLSVSSVFSFRATADEGWTLTTADFKRQPVTLKSFDDKGATVTSYGDTKDKTIPLDRFLQLDRGAAATAQVRGNWALYLASGDRVGGDPVSVANDALTWKSPAAGDLTIPLTHLRGIVKGAESQQPTFDPNRTEDVVYLSNGDTLKGIVTALDAAKVSVKQPSGDVLPVDLAAVKSIHFAAAKADNLTGPAFRVQLADGSVVTAPKLDLKGEKLTLNFGDKAGRPIDLNQVVLIEQLNGPVSWLSARTPASVVSESMLGLPFPPRMDRTYNLRSNADRIKFGNREYARGIGVHAYTKLTYALDGNFKVLRTQYALPDDAAKARVTVRILLDDRVVHEAKNVGPGKLSPVLLIDLGNAKTLSLECHPGGDTTTDDPTKWNIDTQARLNWIEPALLKEKPQPDPPPAPAAAAETPKPDQPQTDPAKSEEKKPE